MICDGRFVMFQVHIEFLFPSVSAIVTHYQKVGSSVSSDIAHQVSDLKSHCLFVPLPFLFFVLLFLGLFLFLFCFSIPCFAFLFCCFGTKLEM